MLRFVLRRFASAVPTLFVVVTISFFLMRFAPGGPFNMERPLPPQILENMKRAYHLDDSLWQQYLNYLVNLLHGDFGPSYIYRDFSVRELMLQNLPYSLTLGSFALLIAVIGGVGLGTFAALRQNSFVDVLVMSFANLGITVPNFVVGPVLTLILALTFSLLPAGGWGDGSPKFLILPIITLALPELAVFARLMRGSMLEALGADHIRTARAYGLPPRVLVVGHAMRAGILPVITYLGPAAAQLLTGSAVVETIFSIPGVGRFFVKGALDRDYTLVMATVVLVSIFIVLFNLLVDLLYAFLDPRVQHD
jgi:oligopeptide transport system permease protein